MDRSEEIAKRLEIILGRLPSAALKGRPPKDVMALHDTQGQITEASCVDSHGIGRDARLVLADNYHLEFCWDGTHNRLLANLTICPVHHVETYEV